MPPFVRVVPAIRTPIGIDGFDFSVPDQLAINIGDLVLVPFRHRPTPALVTETLSQTAFADRIKPISRTYADIRFPQSTVTLLKAVAARTFTSQPTVLKSWLRSPPKRPTPNVKRAWFRVPGSAPHAPLSHWSPNPENDLIQNAEQHLQKNERVLILVPWLTRAKRIHAAIPNARLYTNDLNDGDAFRSWSSFLSGETRCLVATRLGAWIGSFADIILLDEPENDDHKQDELAPRYDARWIAHWCCKHANADVKTFGTTPRLVNHETDLSPILSVSLRVHIRHPSGKTSIPMIQGDTLVALREHEGPRVIIHPVRGTYARLVCRDCGWRAACEHCHGDLAPDIHDTRCRTCGKTAALPLACESCGGTSLNKSWPGLVTLKEAWAKHETDLAVSWRDLSNESMDAPFPKQVLVVVTDGALLGGISEDIRRQERRLIAFRRLASHVAIADGSLIIQCHEDLSNGWADWLTPEGVEAAMERERKERKTFGYPPAIRLVKIITQGDENAAHTWMRGIKDILPPIVSIRGPFAVRFRPSSGSARWIWHIIFPKDIPEARLISLLRPHARGAIIDLDSVAFFM